MPVYILTSSYQFPSPELAEKDGLLAIGGDLNIKRLLNAYSMGIFPWYSKETPILWWSPNPRLVLFPHELHVTDRLRRIIKKQTFEITYDLAFNDVIRLCAHVHTKEDGSTWLTDEMIYAYINLHKIGYAHSVECWLQNGLVGGLYGVSMGAVFFGESMFHKVSNSSKVAFVSLVERLKNRGFKLIDCQVTSNHLKSFGAREIRRSEFLNLLNEYTNLNVKF